MKSRENTHKLLCIICPEGCEIEATEQDGKLQFEKGICRKGREYAECEIRDPARVLTSTVPVSGGVVAMLPVRTAAPVPKARLEEIMVEIKKISVTAPVRIGETVASDIGGTGVALVAGRDVESGT
jgi:CxxC motif-containing protein